MAAAQTASVLTDDGFGVPSTTIDPTETAAPASKSEEEQRAEDVAAAKAEFESAFAFWLAFKDPWIAEGAAVDELMTLVDHDIGAKLQFIVDKFSKQVGLLPLMCVASKGQLGALNSESYAERVFSCANLLVTDHRTRLRNDLIDMFVVLRMNREWMNVHRKAFKDLRKAKLPVPFDPTTIPEGEGSDDEHATANEWPPAPPAWPPV
jgi:hypothetical protein